MVYCSKCGTKNKDASKFCVKCGAKLNVSKGRSLEERIEKGAEDFGKRAEEWGENFGKRAEAWGKDFEKHTQEDCFGLPYGGTIFGLIIGLIVVLIGLSLLAGVDIEVWPLIVIIFGVLIFGGAVYTLIRKR